MTKRKLKSSPAQLANLKPIKKGEVRNPNGGRAHDPVKKELKRITNETFKELIELALLHNLAALQEIVKNPDTPSIKVGVATSLITAIKNGNWSVLESIIERLVGKMTVNIDHTSGGEKLPQIQVFGYIPANGSEAIEEPTKKDENEKS